MTVAAILLALQAGTMARPDGMLTAERLRAMPTAVIARRFLGGERAADAERAEVQSDLLAEPEHVFLYHRVRPMGPDICVRPVHHVRLNRTMAAATREERDRVPLAVEGIDEGVMITVAPACRFTPRHSFAHINDPVTVDEAAEALRTVAAARRAAAGRRALSIRLTCRQQDEDDHGGLRWRRCRGGARPALATLEVGRPWRVERNFETDNLSVALHSDSDLTYWEVELSGSGTGRARLAMARQGYPVE